VKKYVDLLKEVCLSTVPIGSIVLLMFVYPTSPDPTEIFIAVLCFIGLIFGFSLFLYGVGVGVMPMGVAIGSDVPKHKNILVVFGILTVIGFVLTMAEPDVNVVANLIHGFYPNLNSFNMMVAISAGISIFFILATVRIVLKITLRMIFTAGYGIIIALALLSPEMFLGISFDSGGVTTGPLSFPVLLSIGIGINAAVLAGDE
jgi:hypothetical protein